MISYVLPLRWESDAAFDELSRYLRWLCAIVDDVVVVDGSPAALFARHARALDGMVRHVPVDSDLRFLNGKVNGVHTGMRLVKHDAVVIADDDVRYDAQGLAAVAAALESFDVVRPQNYFSPAPWHACWDSGRILLNRAIACDWPGTFGVRKEAFDRAGGYDGNVLFENLEMVRTLKASGARVLDAHGIYVRRVPPDGRRFWSQRVRQAYDEFARPAVMAGWLAVVPTAIVLLRRRLAFLAAVAASSIAVAEHGRRKKGGSTVFPWTASLYAPVWLSERGVCSWIAMTSRLFHGGLRYAGNVISRAATPERVLRRTFNEQQSPSR
ncbi:MAG: hypothetical protein NVSMB57_16200 [Actinomycetota bacterium]